MEEKKKGNPKTAHSLNRYGKSNKFWTQYQIVYRSFKEHPKTMLDVSLQTGILRANICRYVADMEEKGLIQLLYKSEDEHTKTKAGYYTTNKAIFRKSNDNQPRLWEVE